jgi:NhaP-type Na+/H+ or K+/H+ antiporter
VKGVPLFHAALAAGSGMGAQALAQRFGLPSIVLLLATGVIIGPDALAWLDPQVLGSGRTELVSLAVIVILFEGGLALRIEDLRVQQRPLLMLLTVGSLISMVGGTLAAHGLLGMPWETAALYGALMIVTGPTVVTPLLMRLNVDRPVRELLIGEGVLNDPIGAISAIVLMEYVVGRQSVVASGGLVVSGLVVGAAIGAAAGLLMALVLGQGWVRDDLWNAVVLAAVLLAATVANRLSPEAGLVTAVVQGMVMGNARLKPLQRLRQFNEEVTVILLSFIFVLLAADLRVAQVAALGWRGVAVVAVMAWLVRPLTVFVATAGSALTVGQRVFMSWVCPRGVVAASVAGLFRIILNDAGVPGGEQLEALVFVTVALTVAVQGLTVGLLAHALGVDVPSFQGVVIVGAGRFGRFVAHQLRRHGAPVVVVDRNPQFCRQAQAEGLSVFQGDGLSVETLEEAGARYVDTVLALTSNAELNALVADTVHQHLRVPRVLAAGDESTRQAARASSIPFPGDFPGPGEIDWLLQRRRFEVAVYDEARPAAQSPALVDLPYAAGEFALLLQRRSQVRLTTPDATLEAGDTLVTVRPRGSQSEIGSLFARVHVETDAKG